MLSEHGILRASTEFRIVPAEHLIQIFARQQIPYRQGLTLVTVPEADHWVQQDAAQLVTRTMAIWLRRYYPTKSPVRIPCLPAFP